jgi:hypothetical protein
MSIIPSKNKVTIIEGEDNDLSQWPANQLPYKTDEGMIEGSGLRILSSGTLLAPVGFAVESGSIDFGDVLRLSESAGFLAFENMVDREKYQLLDYAVPRTAPSSKPYYFKLIEAERKALNTDGDSVVTTNPLSFEYRTLLTARTNSITFKATAAMTNVRLRIRDKDSDVAVKYFPSKSAWVEGVGGTGFTVGDNVLDFQDTALIFQAGTDIIFDIVADNVSLSASAGIPKFSAMVQEGVFVGVADVTEIANIQSQVDDLDSGFSGIYADLTGIPAMFTPSPHQHSISDVIDLEDTISSLSDAIESANGSLDDLAVVATTGDYQDLLNKPSIPTVSYPVTSINTKTGSVVLTAADVGAIGVGEGINYSQITNPPTIPVAPTNTSQLINDSGYISSVTYPVISVNGKTGSVVLTSGDVGAASLAHSHPISDIAGLQASLDSKALASSLADYATNIYVTNGLSLKLNTPSGNTNQYIRGDGTLALFPAIPVSSVNGKTGVVVLNPTDIGAAAFGHTHVISEVVGLQATLDGKASASDLSGYATTTALTTGLAGKFNNPTGTTAQYVSGNGSLVTFPAIPTVPTNISAFTNDSGYVNQAGARSSISLTTTGSGAATYNSSTGVLNVPAPTTRTYANPARTLNSAFQISATRDAMVSYAVDITVSALIVGGTSGRVWLEYANEVGFTTGVTVVTSSGASTSGVLNVTVLGTANLTGLIPTGKFVRLRTQNVTGTPTYSFQSSQEVVV